MYSSTIQGLARLAAGGAALVLASIAPPALAQFAESHDAPEPAMEEDTRGVVPDWAGSEEVSEYAVEAADADAGEEVSASQPTGDLTDWQRDFGAYEMRRASWENNLRSGAMLYSWRPAAYRAVAVHGAGSSGFLYLRQDNFLGLDGETFAEKVEAMSAAGAFGPHPEGAMVRAKPGYSYYFFPLCDGAPRWEARTFQYIPDEGAVEVALSCPE
ncbi:hypothetical protein [Erythrobacter mangrovi]|uniref:Uncharacterized protein n=1 Tax=Erythrobacter mangrovi TaxID=2739433 RepID=A0A7D4BB30_9SPHN|nr:hypothetical protein [Erythrobacter mangrovi]QKG71881.1 hypothetical protein HQR01_11220 [Erythrobacter mangrovi]